MLARLIKKFFRKSRPSNCEQLFLVFFPQLFLSNCEQLFLVSWGDFVNIPYTPLLSAVCCQQNFTALARMLLLETII